MSKKNYFLKQIKKSVKRINNNLFKKYSKEDLNQILDLYNFEKILKARLAIEHATHNNEQKEKTILS